MTIPFLSATRIVRSGRVWRWSLFLAALSTFLFSVSRPAPTPPSHQLVGQLYQASLTHFDSTLAALSHQVDGHRPQADVQASFRVARLAYKQIEPLTEYYFLQSAKKLNGPDVPEGVDRRRKTGVGRLHEIPLSSTVRQNQRTVLSSYFLLHSPDVYVIMP